MPWAGAKPLDCRYPPMSSVRYAELTSRVDVSTSSSRRGVLRRLSSGSSSRRRRSPGRISRGLRGCRSDDYPSMSALALLSWYWTTASRGLPNHGFIGLEGVKGNLPAAAAAASCAALEAAVLYSSGNQRTGRGKSVLAEGVQKTHRLAKLEQRRRRTQRQPQMPQPAMRRPARQQPVKQRRQQLQVGGKGGVVNIQGGNGRRPRSKSRSSPA